MSYGSLTTLTQYGLPTAALTNVPTATQQAALNAAADEIDTYLRSRYSVPLLSAPLSIIKAEAVLAAADLLTTKGHNPTFFDQAFQLRVDRTLRWLEKLSAGSAHLAADVDATPEVSEGGPQISSRGPRASFSSTIYTNTPRGW